LPGAGRKEPMGPRRFHCQIIPLPKSAEQMPKLIANGQVADCRQSMNGRSPREQESKHGGPGAINFLHRKQISGTEWIIGTTHDWMAGFTLLLCAAFRQMRGAFTMLSATCSSIVRACRRDPCRGTKSV